jgi:hypothetical protein
MLWRLQTIIRRGLSFTCRKHTIGMTHSFCRKPNKGRYESALKAKYLAHLSPISVMANAAIGKSNLQPSWPEDGASRVGLCGRSNLPLMTSGPTGQRSPV